MIAMRPDAATRERYYAAGYWRDQTIFDLVTRQIAQAPNKVAVKDSNGHSITFAELNRLSARFAGYLRQKGFEEGDILTMHLPNWWHAAVVMSAVYRLGGTIHAAPPTYGWQDLAYVLQKCRSKAVVAASRFRHADYLANLRKVREMQELPAICVLIGEAGELGTSFEETLNSTEFSDTAKVSPDSPAAIVFTSGTESLPKGVVHTHNTLLFGERVFADRLGLTADDVCFMATPISHMTGFAHGLVLNLTRGCTLSLLDVFEGRRAVDIMRAEGATWTMGATPFLYDTVSVLEETKSQLPSLRYFLCGGAPLPEAVVRRALKSNIRVLPVYGSTESPPHTLTRPDAPIEQSWETDGEVLPGIEMRVVDNEGRDLVDGSPGEEISRGPNTFIGYLDAPDLTARAVDEDGWYHSGDIATLRPGNTVKIVGRTKDIIIRGGQNISPREIEDLLAAHPAVRSVAIVGRPHDRLGETAVAVVVMRDNSSLSFAEMSDFLIQRGIGRYKLPEELQIWPELPQTPSGKIQKFLIREKLKQASSVSP